jgi:hypothetical protein
MTGLLIDMNFGLRALASNGLARRERGSNLALLF